MPNTAIPTLPMQELSAGHALAMECAARANRFVDRAGSAGRDQRAGLESVRMAGLAARLMEGVEQGIGRLRGLGAAGLGSAPDAAIGSHASAATSRTSAAARQVSPAASARPKLHATPGQRRGCLKNGNPAGDYLKSRRCGARTRAGCGCRQPAMANGRCRLHGGLSTGPRTPEGLARCRTTRLTHGYRSRELIGLRRRAAHAARRLRSLTRTFSAGHGVHRSDFTRNPLATVVPKQSAQAAASLRKHPVGKRSSAGHGVHRSDSIGPKDPGKQSNKIAPTAASPRLRAPSSARGGARSAGNGVHRSFRDHLLSSAPVSGSQTVPRTLPISAGHGLHRPDRANRQPLT